MNKKKLGTVLAAVLLVGAVFFVTLRPRTTEASKLTVVATYYPLYDFARAVGGDKIEATNITPAGSEPHDFEPSPQTLVQAQKAAVFVYNGSAFEPWVDKFLPDYRHVSVRASDSIELHATDGVKDPHFWLDPVLARQIVANIRDGLIKADPANKDYFTQRANQYMARLTQLDQDYASSLRSCRVRTIVTAHDAFGYIAKRYNLEVVPIAGLSPEEEPSAAKLAEVSRLVTEKGITHIFFETLTSPRLAQTIARETGAKTAVFDPIEGLTDADQKQGKDYLSVQRENLANLRSALACQ